MDHSADVGDSTGHHRPGSWSPLRWLVGLVSLALRSGSELAHLAGQIHRTVAETPPPFSLAPLKGVHLKGAHGLQSDTASIPQTYHFVRLLLEQGSDRLHDWVSHLPTEEHLPHALRRFHSGMNGVIGDKLHAWGHPLAQSMELVDHAGRGLSLAQLQADCERGVLLFLPGLCLSEFDWQSPANQRFVKELQQQGLGVAWLRYNGGLPIWENGRAFCAFLDAHWQEESGKPLTLVGHSMGGLVIRSAVHHAEHVESAPWLNALEGAAYLASPHSGAPLEKIGNFANSLLGVSPYSKPLMALGNIRSLGIRSLRHGNIVAPVDETERQYPLPFNPRIRHFLLAARLWDDPAKRWMGDGLVPVASAMGEPHFPADHENIERVMLEQAGHLRLLGDERTYEALRRWLGMPVAPA